MTESPSHIGPYRVIERLGRGAMGVVFWAEHPESGQAVAIKTLRMPSDRHLAALRREVRSLAQVDHPGVVRVIDEGVQDGLPWYAMERLVGVTLWEHRINAHSPATGPGAPNPEPDSAPTVIETSKAPIEAASLQPLLTLFRRLCDPLGYVHGEGLVHCDLKPNNVLIIEGAQPVLVDFGLISRFGAHLREDLDFELFVGTPEYMAPEQWEGRPVDARTDLYALGCMLYECLTGQVPYCGPRAGLRQAHLKAPIPRAQALAPQVPRGLDDLLQALLAKSPAQRPGHVDEVARVLESLGAEIPEPGPVARPYLFRPALAGRGRVTHELVQRVAGQAARGGVVLLAGETGVGKTRLAMEVLRLARRAGLRVLTSECLPHTRVLDPVRSLLLATVELCREQPHHLEALLGAQGRVLARLEPALLSVPGIREAPEPEPMPAEAERLRLLQALVHTATALSELQPTVWVLDDLHAADRLTFDFLESVMLRAKATRGLCILATYRSGEVPGALSRLLNRPGVEAIELSRLNARAVSRMVTDMLGVEPPEGLVPFLAAQSEGNPLFVAEYLWAAVGADKLTRDEQGQWRLRGGISPEQLDLPASLVTLLVHRLEHLSPNARCLADAGAVLGREFDSGLTVEVAYTKGDTHDLALSELLRKRVFEEAPSGRLRFSHDKLREVAYAQLGAQLRLELHRRCARELEKARNAGTKEASAATLAHHWIEAGQPAKAVVELDLAAEEALSTGGYREATWHLKRALKLSAPDSKGPSVALTPMKRATWHQRLGETYLAAGRLAQSRTHAETALDLLDVARPRSRAGWVRTLASQCLRQLAHRLLPQGVFVSVEGQAALAEATQATAHMARIAFFENDPLRLVATSLWSINLAERADALSHAARNYSGLAWTCGLLGWPRAANAYFARAQRVGYAHRDWPGLIFCLTSEALYRTGLGEFEAAEAALEACNEPCDMAQDPQGRELALTLSGHPLYFRGEFPRAIERHEEVLRSALDRHNDQHAAWSSYCIARAQLARADFEAARENLQQAAQRLDPLSDKISDITCTGLRAILALRTGDLSEAQRLAEQTDTLLGQTLPTAFITLHGFEAVAEVAIYAFSKSGQVADRRRAARAVRRHKKAAARFAVGQARAHLLRGRLARLQGDLKGAARLLTRGQAWAQPLGLRYDEACLLQEVGRLFDERQAERAVQNRLAGRIFDELGCARPEGAYLDSR